MFGADGFDANDVGSIKEAVSAYIKMGIPHFRLINIGAWQSGMMDAVNEAAGDSGGDQVSLMITSMGFSSKESCPELPDYMDYSVANTASKLKALTNVKRIFVQLDAANICPGDKLNYVNPTEMGLGQDTPDKAGAIKEFVTSEADNGYGPGHITAAHKAMPSNVEFVIPWMKDANSPPEMVEALVEKYIGPAQKEGRKFHLESTSYPFHYGTGQDMEPFPTDVVKGWLSESQSLGFDGFVVAETGWPHECPGKADRPASEDMQCKYMTTVMEGTRELASGGGLLVYLWHFGKGDDGSPCKTGFGMLKEDGSLRCPDAGGAGGNGDDS